MSAEDATQETFVRVQRNLDKMPAGKEALHWTYRIATNYCLNEVRDRKRRPEPVGEVPESAITNLTATLEHRDLLRQVIARAPEKLRAPAWLYHFDGLEHAEIAAVLGVSKRTVASRIEEFAARARKLSERK